jgi:hypothetical protein
MASLRSCTKTKGVLLWRIRAESSDAVVLKKLSGADTEPVPDDATSPPMPYTIVNFIFT